MKLTTLRDFIAVAERGGIRTAARQLSVPQPALSRSIRELEKELEIALFERHSKGVRLTPVGEIFLRRAKAIYHELGRAQDEIAQLRGSTHGRVTLCMSTAPHLGIFTEVFEKYRAKYRDVHLEIIDSVYPLIEPSLLDGTIDIYIGPIPPRLPGELQAEKLFDNTRIIVGRRNHPLAKAKSLHDLVDAQWITTSITYKAEEELGPLFEKHGLSPPYLALRAQSALTFLTALTYSDLLMMVPIQWIQSPLLRDAVQEIKVVEALPAPSIFMVQRAGLPLTPAAEYFCTLIRRAAASHRA